MRPHLGLLALVLFWAFTPPSRLVQDEANAAAAHRVLWVDSYNPEYAWSKGIERGIRSVLDGKPVTLEVFHMDTKRHKAVDQMQAAAVRAVEVVKRLRPDVIIASDDNAQKYLVLPHLLGSGVPVVYCGLNWNSSAYDYPRPGITGMVEVPPVASLLRKLERFAKGRRVGYLSEATLSGAKEAAHLKAKCGDMPVNVYMAHDFAEFKKAFLQAQQENDMLVLAGYMGIDGWAEAEAQRFVEANTRIPTGSCDGFMERYVLFTMAKSPEEQGEFAAKQALRILAGESPNDMPEAVNERCDLTVNMKLAHTLGLVIPLRILRAARVINADMEPPDTPAREKAP